MIEIISYEKICLYLRDVRDMRKNVSNRILSSSFSSIESSCVESHVSILIKRRGILIALLFFLKDRDD